MISRCCGSSTSNCNIMKPHRLTGIGCHLEMMKTESLIVVTALRLIDVIIICSVLFVWVCLLSKDYCIALYNHVISKNKPVNFFTWIMHWIMWQVNEGPSLPLSVMDEMLSSVTSKWNILKEQCFTRWLEKQVRSYMLHYFKIKLELAFFSNSQLKWHILKWNLNTILHENKTQVPLSKIKNIYLLKSTTPFYLHINLS